MHNLSKIFGVVLFLFVMFFASTLSVVAVETKDKSKSVLVLSDRVEQANTKYFIYPQVSEMIAADIINRLNTEGDVKAPSLSDVRSELRSSELVRAAYSLLDNYRYTYDVNYSALRKIAKHFDVTNVLLVTGSLDTTSDFLKPTWWAFLNVPGENSVKSEFKLYTYMALIDLNNETITWQNVYERKLVDTEFGLGNMNFSPDAKQMVKVKQGSLLIAKDAAYRVESVLTPLRAAEKTPPTVHEFVKFKVNKKYEESIQNINEFKKKTIEKIKNKEAVKKETKDAEKSSVAKDEFERIEIPAVETNIDNETEPKEKNVILKFVKTENAENEKKEILDSSVNAVRDENVINQESSKDLNNMELRPAIEMNKNIQINPINIIIPKM